MLFRLYSDSINVSNVDLYYTNNSQVYGGLFLLNKQKNRTPTFDTVTNLSFRKIKSTTVLTKKSVKFYFTCFSVVTFLRASTQLCKFYHKIYCDGNAKCYFCKTKLKILIVYCISTYLFWYFWIVRENSRACALAHVLTHAQIEFRGTTRLLTCCVNMWLIANFIIC